MEKCKHWLCFNDGMLQQFHLPLTEEVQVPHQFGWKMFLEGHVLII